MSSSSKAIDPETVIIIDDRYRIRKMGRNCKILLRTFFQGYVGGYRLPLAMVKWMESTNSKLAHDSETKSGVKNCSIEFSRWGRLLKVDWAQIVDSSDSTLLLHEDTRALETYQRETAGLTHRQKQVYHLLKDGVSDISTISKKLDISLRMAQRHRQNLSKILQKMAR